MKNILQGYINRPATLDDIPAITEAINHYTQALTNETYTTEQHLKNYLTTPGFDLRDSSRVVLASNDQLCGYAVVADFIAPHIRTHAWAFVPREEQGRGIGTALHRWMESRAREAIEKAPDGTRVCMIQSVYDADEPAMSLLESCGYSQSRHYWRMTIALSDSDPSPRWPSGISIETADLRKDLETPFRALNEAFRDHYGHIEGDLEERMEQQRHYLESDPDYTPELCFLAKAQDQIAGVCLGYPKLGDNPAGGYIQSLGVLRPWRNKGLGLALLHHTFHTMRQLGKAKVALHVDSESLTGATRLYEKAGMKVDQLSHEYELELRPGTDLSTARSE